MKNSRSLTREYFFFIKINIHRFPGLDSSFTGHLLAGTLPQILQPPSIPVSPQLRPGSPDISENDRLPDPILPELSPLTCDSQPSFDASVATPEAPSAPKPKAKDLYREFLNQHITAWKDLDVSFEKFAYWLWYL